MRRDGPAGWLLLVLDGDMSTCSCGAGLGFELRVRGDAEGCAGVVWRLTLRFPGHGCGGKWQERRRIVLGFLGLV